MSEHEYVADQGRWEEVVDEIARSPIYALDTEFHRERTYYPRLALVQLAWPGGLVLADPFAVDLAPLADVLRSGGLPVLHAADQDLEVLELAVGAVPDRLFDTQLAAGFLGLSTPSLGTLIERFLHIRLPKGDRLSDWNRRPLTADQRAYAASDVAHLLELHDRLEAELERAGRRAWAQQECERLLRRPRGAPEPERAWWRLKESRQLRGRARAVAQEVAAWRERRAAELDVPPRHVLPDMAISAIAHRPPRSARDLAAVRGLDGRHVKGEASAAILAAVERGLALPEAELRRPPTDELDRGLRPAVTLVSAWIGQLASDLHIDASLLATRADLQAFLRGDPDALLANGWRAELVGEPVARLVHGRAALAFDGDGGLVLEERSHSAVRSTSASQPSSPKA